MIIWAGSIVGLLLGLAHAVYVFRAVASSEPANSGPNYTRGAYYAIWVLGLWILSGTYILVLWLAGVLFYLMFKVFR